MDPSQYKDYVLVLLFIKYISDKYAGKPFAPITIPDGSSFADMVALKGTDDIGDQINKKIIAPLAQVNNLSDMPDFADPSKLGSGKEMVERLTNLIALFEDPRLDFSKNRADGDDILGEGFTFDLEIRRGAGAYICGEETAIFNSIEGFRGEPRSKPPFPVEKGVFQKPTAINNVETLINVLDVLMKSGPGYAEMGTQGSTGTKLFCLSGCVTRPGVYEVPFGGTLRELIDMAGGVPDGRELQAVLLGGAAGSFVRADELDIELSFEAVREAKTTLGSGVVMVFDDSVNMHRILQRIAQFFRNESCGQCVPCRVGTVRQQEALARLASGKPRESVEQELELISEIGGCMRDASICGLGQAASSAVESAIDRLGVFKGGAQ